MLRSQEQRESLFMSSNLNFILGHVYRSKTLRQLADHQVKHNQKITNQDIGTWIKHQHPKLQWFHARKLDRIFYDIDKARTSIIISLPADIALSARWKQRLLNRKKE